MKKLADKPPIPADKITKRADKGKKYKLNCKWKEQNCLLKGKKQKKSDLASLRTGVLSKKH
jgi:hypothetical protein